MAGKGTSVSKVFLSLLAVGLAVLNIFEQYKPGLPQKPNIVPRTTFGPKCSLGHGCSKLYYDF